MFNINWIKRSDFTRAGRDGSGALLMITLTLYALVALVFVAALLLKGLFLLFRWLYRKHRSARQARRQLRQPRIEAAVPTLPTWSPPALGSDRPSAHPMPPDGIAIKGFRAGMSLLDGTLRIYNKAAKSAHDIPAEDVIQITYRSRSAFFPRPWVHIAVPGGTSVPASTFRAMTDPYAVPLRAFQRRAAVERFILAVNDRQARWTASGPALISGPSA